ncbi:MAG: DinB family protein [Acidobacteria bacterium]|nr:DinB family protein [Acidobacteriota bacterium]
MKVPLCFLLAFSSLFAQMLTEGERGRALSELQGTRKLFLDSVADLSDAQWNFKPDARTWSIGECAEHIALSEDELFAMVTNKIMKSPADPAKRAETKGKDETVLRIIADRSKKSQAPPSLTPAHKFKSRQELIDHFKQSRDRTLDYIRTTRDDLRSHFAPKPAVGTMDAYQWILLISAHSGRHVAQINEIKANPKYPRN